MLADDARQPVVAAATECRSRNAARRVGHDPEPGAADKINVDADVTRGACCWCGDHRPFGADEQPLQRFIEGAREHHWRGYIGIAVHAPCTGGRPDLRLAVGRREVSDDIDQGASRWSGCPGRNTDREAARRILD